MRDMPEYDFTEVQVPLVEVSMALHNYIHRNASVDEVVDEWACGGMVADNLPNN